MNGMGSVADRAMTTAEAIRAPGAGCGWYSHPLDIARAAHPLISVGLEVSG